MAELAAAGGVDAADGHGWTALMWAARLGREQVRHNTHTQHTHTHTYTQHTHTHTHNTHTIYTHIYTFCALHARFSDPFVAVCSDGV